MEAFFGLKSVASSTQVVDSVESTRKPDGFVTESVTEAVTRKSMGGGGHIKGYALFLFCLLLHLN